MRGMHQLAERLRREGVEPTLAPALIAARAQAGHALSSKLDWPTAKAENMVGSAIEQVQQHAWRSQEAQRPSAEALAQAQQTLVEMPESSARLVFVDGHFVPSLTTQATSSQIRFEAFGTSAQPAAQRGDVPVHLGALGLHTDEPYAALNTALLSDGVRLEVASGHREPQPLAVVFVTTNHAHHALVQPRVVVAAGSGSECTLFERHVSVGDATVWNNSVTEVIADAGANVHVIIEQASNDHSFHMGTIGMRIGKDGHCRLTTIDTGAKLCRRSVRAELLSPGAQCSMWHVAMARGGAHVATKALTRHLASDTQSAQRFRAVADKQGQASFCGTVQIVPDASRANAEQMSRGMLLAPSGKISLRPQLKIAHDDVKCAHGATVGALDAEALFYLMSRGIDERDAKELLTFAFLGDALEGVSTSIRHHFEQAAARWLGSEALPLASRALTQEPAW